MADDATSGKREPFLPKIVDVFRQGYSAKHAVQDVFAGLTVGVVALPLAMAFAIASGTTPERGLFTAIVAGFLISALGGSRYQIGGPTGAFVVIVYSIIDRHGYDGLVLCTLMAGVLMLLFGAFRMGSLIKYIPYPVTTGFTAGIAVLIFSSQMKDFLGLPMETVPPDFLDKWAEYFGHVQGINPATLTVSGVGLITILLIRRFIPRVPAPVVSVFLATLVAYVFSLPVETIGSRFGGVPDALPSLTFPMVTLERVRELIPDALTVALLGGIESLLSCVVADGMTGDRHQSNTELMAQGVANIASPLFGGLPATGAIARTVTNIRAGAFSPVAGMLHAVVLAAFILFLAPVASFIPLASLAAVLVVVAWDMSEYHKVLRLLRAPKSDMLVMLLTLLLTVLIDLTVAVNVGVVLAALLFMRRMSETTEIEDWGHNCCTWKPDLPRSEFLELPHNLMVYEIDGPFFFGVADRFKSVLHTLDTKPKVIVLRMGRVPAIDATADNALEVFAKRCQKDGTRLILAGVRPRALANLKKMGTLKAIGEENIFDNFGEALDRARRVVAFE
ncbi:SulP family inorganic anion transporter [Megalodesulfovibrio gigas]|uniref:Putative sulfate transporter n=1 Tax=Megalodesulfovibrio gigas (strain ATCC 19364 / DSM 1382 / NCIMB 9332 / VKM B-1759) TaxID=1121448 RepID=T2G7Y3_MEGG1|nr:sulfate permease [Megalodesulfovibrio gigas]AGW12294.1 putative sulfate transporter [Megalodesulfovibrio gigas DSM 1382 = ATCC 19364]